MTKRRWSLREHVVDARGISLPETLVAIMLIAIGAFAAVVVQRTGVKGNQDSYAREVAVSLARQLAEAIEQVPYNPTTGTYAGCLNVTSGTGFANPCAALSPANPLDATGSTTLGGMYSRQMRVEIPPSTQVLAAGTPVPWHPASSPTPANALTMNGKRIRVRVTYDDRGQQRVVEVATFKSWTNP